MTSTSGVSEMKRPSSPDAVVSRILFRILKSHCNPIHDIPLLQYLLKVPSPSQMLPISDTFQEYVKLLALNDSPSDRAEYAKNCVM